MEPTVPALEVWQRGPLPNIPPLLQPVAHALLQAREELAALLVDFPDALLWKKPAGLASPGFHLQHLSGVIDRVFTYARGEALNEDQMDALHTEDVHPNPALSVHDLQDRFNRQVDIALLQLQQTTESTLTDFRGVGRKQLPSTVIGLLVHGAEHTMRHLGQLHVTVKILVIAIPGPGH
ncbi:MAG: DinB family protein [Bacteroidota bacterium]